MGKLATLIIALALLGVATAATAQTEQTALTGNTMSCFVDTPANDEFTPTVCSAVVNRQSTKAVFRVDNFTPGANVQWSDSRCVSGRETCTVTIRAYVQKTMRATVGTPGYRVSASARYERGD
jgi:hypothetical protein